MTAGLTQEGYRYRQLLPGKAARHVSAQVYEADLGNLDSLREVRELMLGSSSEPIGGLVNFLGVSSRYNAPGCISGSAALEAATWSFAVLKTFADDLIDASRTGGGRVLSLTGLGGQFGLSGDRTALTSSGLLGLFKTFRQEYPSLSVKNVDLDLAAPNPLLAGRLIEELSAADPAHEIGLNAAGRWTLQLRLSTPHTSQLGPLPIDKHSVIMVTGGAYGITFDAALKLAGPAHPRLILVGRSPLPDEEAAETRDLAVPQLRQWLIQQRKAAGQPLVPAQIEQNLKRMLKDRQILANLRQLEATGSHVEYHSLDVRDEEAFGGLIDEIYARFGRLDGVLHGAGVIEDKLMRDKTLQSYANVFSTKVDSALLLARRLKPETLKFLVFFSSISGRFGNAGQSDYSAANEFLNKLACDLDRRWPGRVVAVNWGAWDAGMVSDELRRLYGERGIHLIPVPDGVAFLENELRLADRHEPEVVIACSVPQLVRMTAGKV